MTSVVSFSARLHAIDRQRIELDASSPHSVSFDVADHDARRNGLQLSVAATAEQ